MKPKPYVIVLVVLLLGLFAAGCSSGTAAPEEATPPDNPIVGIEWRWLSVSNRSTNETTTVPDPQNYTIVFNDDGTLSGRADCNNFNGTYAQDNGLIITLGATTAAACGPDSLDQQYLSILGTVVAGGPDGAGGLALETAGGEQRMLFANGG
jgi:heat shock protein HslJ